MSADTSRAQGASKTTGANPPHIPMTEEEIAKAAEGQSNLRVLKKVAPYLWPDDLPWVKKRVVWAMIFLLVSKLVSVVIPVLYKGAVDGLAGDGGEDALF